MKKSLLLSLALLLLLFNDHRAQVDSLILKNNDIIIGEIKEMNRGILTIETDYSDIDFKIEWDGIKEINTTTNFLITISNGQRYNGTFATTSGDKVEIRDEEKGTMEVSISDIVYLFPVNDSFASRLDVFIDIGLSLTKANNLKQLNIRSGLGYTAERWSGDANYNQVRSVQDSVEPIKRTDAAISFRKFLPKDWYLPVNLSFLNNTEQKLDLRTNATIGVGKYIIHTNKTYWGFSGGASFVNEVFSSDDPDRKSWEGYFGSELNLFDIGDLSLLTKATVYPGISEKGRWRLDFIFDTKYDLPLDFYIKLGLTLNYDNQPVEDASDTDYVI